MSKFTVSQTLTNSLRNLDKKPTFVLTFGSVDGNYTI